MGKSFLGWCLFSTLTWTCVPLMDWFGCEGIYGLKGVANIFFIILICFLFCLTVKCAFDFIAEFTRKYNGLNFLCVIAGLFGMWLVCSITGEDDPNYLFKNIFWLVSVLISIIGLASLAYAFIFSSELENVE